MNEALQGELKQLIVEALMLEDVRPEQIDTEAPLFGEGLGLDSIDALELAIAIDRRFGVKIEAEDERNKEIFRNVQSLARHIEESRSAGEKGR
jgi:acyl carrier protein